MAKHRKSNTVNNALAIGVGILIGITIYTLNRPEPVTTTQTTSQTIQSSEVQSSSQTIQSSETSAQDSESSISSDSITEQSSTEIEPSAQIPEWYLEAEQLVSDYQTLVDLGHTQNSTFPVGNAVDELRQAVDHMSQYETDVDSLRIDAQQILSSKGYPMDNDLMINDILDRTFSNY